MYILFTCDEWKSKDSMHIVGVATEIKTAQYAVKELLRNGIIKFVDERFELDDVDGFTKDHMWALLENFHITEVPPNEFETDGSHY